MHPSQAVTPATEALLAAPPPHTRRRIHSLPPAVLPVASTDTSKTYHSTVGILLTNSTKFFAKASSHASIFL